MTWLRSLFAWGSARREAEVPSAPPGAIPVHAFGHAPAAKPAPLLDAAARFDRCVAIVLRHEGGLVDHPADPGGITNHGISLRAARGMGGLADTDGDGDVDGADIRALTPAAARAIYRALYWNAVRGDDLPPGVDLAVFDWAVNAGPLRAARGLQRALGVTVDGAIGPATLRWAREREPREVIAEVCRLRLAHLRGLPTWPTFGRGWARRVEEIEVTAGWMARR